MSLVGQNKLKYSTHINKNPVVSVVVPVAWRTRKENLFPQGPQPSEWDRH